MKKRIKKIAVFLLTVMLFLPMISTDFSNVAYAKPKTKHNPKLSYSKKTLGESGETFTLSVRNVDRNVKKITWHTLNDKIATIQTSNDSKTITVTSVKKGTTRIKCTVFYHGGLKYNAFCKVTVKEAASKITINNVYKDKNGRHVIAVGECYDFDSQLTPKDAKEQTYWYIDKTEYASVNNRGIVTGLKPGIVYLTAIAAKSDSGVNSSSVRDTICIEIVKLETYEDYFEYYDYYDYYDYWDYGDYWDYWDSWGWDDWKKHKADKDHLDLRAPAFTNYTLDKSGLLVTLNFDEAMDFGAMQVYNAKAVDYGQTITAETSKILNNASNYVRSRDGKALTINLSAIPSSDWNKKISINLQGVKDISGNSLKDNSTTIIFSTDSKRMPQAKPVSVKRTHYNTLTVTFDREIQSPGYAIINNEWIPGVVDAKNPLQINYTLTSSAVLLTGKQKVSLIYWNSYNVNPEDKLSEGLTDYFTDFTLKTATLTKASYNHPNTIVLTFDGNITGTLGFQVIENNNTDLYSYGYINSNTITITLKSTPQSKSSIYLVPTQSLKITDSLGSPVTITASYIYITY